MRVLYYEMSYAKATSEKVLYTVEPKGLLSVTYKEPSRVHLYISFFFITFFFRA